MQFTEYTADIDIEHSFFGKAKMGSFEPVAKLCHKVVKDRNYTEAEEVKLVDLLHGAINRFCEKYPRTQARTVRIWLCLGSSLKSLRFHAEGYFAEDFASLGPSRPTGDIITAETDLYKREYIQHVKDLLTEAAEEK